MSRIYRATLRCHASDGTLFEPSLHYQTDVALAGSEPDPQDVANAIDTKLQAALRAILPATGVYEELILAEQVIPPDIGVGAVTVNGSSGNLVATDGNTPHGLVPIINLHTGVSSRNARGHIAGPSPGSALFSSGRKWSTSYLALLTTFAALLDDTMSLGAINPTILNPVVYSRTRRLRDQSPWTFKVLSASVNPTPHWLRSRQSSP
jgi:hypothetical protein